MPTQVLSISKDGGSTISLHNLSQCLTTLTVNKGFLAFRWVSLFLICAHCLSSFQWALQSSFPLIRYLEPSLHHLQYWCPSLIIIFMIFLWTLSSMPMAFFYWGAQNWIQPLQCWVERKDHLPWPAGNTPLNATSHCFRMMLAFSALTVHCCLTTSLLSTQTFLSAFIQEPLPVTMSFQQLSRVSLQWHQPAPSALMTASY